MRAVHFHNPVQSEVNRFAMTNEISRDAKSRGVCIAKPMDKDRLVMAPSNPPRYGWREAFAIASFSDPGTTLLEWPPNEFDDEEWTW